MDCCCTHWLILHVPYQRVSLWLGHLCWNTSVWKGGRTTEEGIGGNGQVLKRPPPFCLWDLGP